MRENETESYLQAPMLTRSPPPPFVSCTNKVIRLEERREHNHLSPIAPKRTAPEKRICVEMPHIEREALGEFFARRNLPYNAKVLNDENHFESKETTVLL